jgi:hypothetical protein
VGVLSVDVISDFLGAEEAKTDEHRAVDRALGG